MSMPFVVRSSPIHGLGGFATRFIAAGTRIGEYAGERISPAESARRNEAEQTDGEHPTFYRFELDADTLIDALSGGNDVRFINHGCDPNCVAVRDGGRIYYHASRDIPVGAELLIDYKMTTTMPISLEQLRLFECHCGASSCRGSLLKAVTLAEPLA
jgi:SET domain-containing protein